MDFERLFAAAQMGANAILWLLVAMSVISLAMIFERWLALRKVRRKSENVRLRVHEILQANQLEDVEILSQDRSSLEGRALNYGLRHVQKNGLDGLEEIISSFTLNEKPELEPNLSFLATVGSNAPYLGLLGTVMGIMKAFEDLAATGGNDAVLTGIAHALTATAIGLLVAIPAVVAFNAFSKQVKNILQSIDSVKELCVAYAKTIGRKRGNANLS